MGAFGKPAQLNIKIGAGNTAGDEALGIMAMFSKTMLRKVDPLRHGANVCLLFALMNLWRKTISSVGSSTSSTGVAVTEGATTEEGFFKSISNLTKTLTDAISYFKESPLPVAKKYLDKVRY